jgi:hypothetical protein
MFGWPPGCSCPLPPNPKMKEGLKFSRLKMSCAIVRWAIRCKLQESFLFMVNLFSDWLAVLLAMLRVGTLKVPSCWWTFKTMTIPLTCGVWVACLLAWYLILLSQCQSFLPSFSLHSQSATLSTILVV